MNSRSVYETIKVMKIFAGAWPTNNAYLLARLPHKCSSRTNRTLYGIRNMPTRIVDVRRERIPLTDSVTRTVDDVKRQPFVVDY